MTSRDFCFWLQGYFEVAAASSPAADVVLDEGQVACIQKHLALVFVHEIDPSMPSAKLDAIHAEKPPAAPAKPHPPIGGSGPGGTLYRC